ncbi:hypothetical protein ACHAPT_006047 [Fusarium lateritium]
MDRIAWTYCKDALIPSVGKTAAEEARQRQPRQLTSVVLTQASKLWNRGKQGITYGWVGGDHGGTQSQREKVITVIEEWGWYGDVYFVVANDSAQARPDIVIGFDPSPNEGTWSLVGTDCLKAAPGAATMNLGCINTDSAFTTAEKAVILHQFGHALGMLHEHDSPAHGGVPLRADALGGIYGAKAWSDVDVRGQIINLYNLRDTTSFPQVDRMSIMQCPLPTIVTGLSHDVGYNYSLSDMDKAYIALMYPRTWTHVRAPEWTPDAALAVIGMTGQDPVLAQKIRELARAPGVDGSVNPTKIRDLFSKWIVLSHVTQQSGGTGAVPPSPQPETESPALQETLRKTLSEAITVDQGQILTLQFPTRTLAKDDFEYMPAGALKPVAASESEFRLTDALYDAAPAVSGPNGLSLSTVYGEAINNLIPRYDTSDKKAREERERIRNWLLEEPTPDGHDSPSETNPSRKINRLQLSNILMQEYYEAQRDWELRRDGIISEGFSSQDPERMAKANTELLRVTESEKAKLAAKYADAVVRGRLHLVREAVAHLDFSTPAEILQDAKDALRLGATPSLYSAGKVYPVQMSPVDWSTSLETGFTTEDLAEDPDNLIATIKSKAKILDTQNKRLALLQNSSDVDPAVLRQEVDAAAKAVDKAKSDMRAKYSDSAIQLARIILSCSTSDAPRMDDRVDAGVKRSVAAAQEAESTARAELVRVVQAVYPAETDENVLKQARAIVDAQRNLQTKTSIWSANKAALTRVASTDSQGQLSLIEKNISRLAAELDDLQDCFMVAKQAREKALQLGMTKTLTVDDLVLDDFSATCEQNWQVVNLHHSVRSQQDLWSADEPSLISETTNDGQSIEIDISFKVSLVTVDRSSWFKPQLFNTSNKYMRNDANVSVNTWPEGATPTSVAAELSENQSADAGLLPCYPVSYILCKDVTIKVSGLQLDSPDAIKDILHKSQSSNRFLCFRYNNASGCWKDASRAAFALAADGMVVRIPGPQVLGYVQQIVARDESTPYEASQSIAQGFHLPAI